MGLKGDPPRLNKSGLARLVNERHLQHWGQPFPLTLAHLARLLGPENGPDRLCTDQGRKSTACAATPFWSKICKPSKVAAGNNPGDDHFPDEDRAFAPGIAPGSKNWTSHVKTRSWGATTLIYHS